MTRRKGPIVLLSAFLLGAFFGAATLSAYALITVPESGEDCQNKSDPELRFRNFLNKAYALSALRERVSSGPAQVPQIRLSECFRPWSRHESSK